MQDQWTAAAGTSVCVSHVLVVVQDKGSSEELTQGIVALALTGLIVAATTTILWRIVVVAWALVAAAIRYSIVAVFLILIAAFLT